MAAADREDDWWLQRQRWREERMRYEVLSMLYEAVDKHAEIPIEIGGFIRRIGVWQHELNRVLGYLAARGFIRYEPGLPEAKVSLTIEGIDYLERDAARRRTIRDP